ncbi:MAG: hypothetical protein BGN88_08135 [Clostridiales bacterium 43-6]|nr:MAG: hypothetical protein BGN88_08135 [Clostridiales bacterium 43-6]
MAGNYQIQVRAKGIDAGSYEAVKNFDVTVAGTSATIAEEDITVKFYNITTGVEVAPSNLVARVPVEVRIAVPSGNNDLYYKLLVSDNQLGTYEVSKYSPDGSILWTPRKALDFSVKVYTRNSDSFGIADMIKTVSVTAS